MARNILVTGGAGFIGSNFIHYWVSKYPQDKIVNYDKLTYAGNLASLKDIESNPNYKFVKGDITNYDLVEKTIQENKIGLIVHFAAETHNDRCNIHPDLAVRTNIVGTQTLLEVARKKLENGDKIHLHHISTDEVFGHLPLDKPEAKFSETTPYWPRAPYPASKAGSDHLVRAYNITYKLPVTISNCSNNYGSYQHAEKLIPLTITRALNNQEIPVYGDGLNVRDWIHVNDHNWGVDLIINKGEVGGTYLLGGNGEKSNMYIIKKILHILGKSENLIVHVGDRKGHDRRYAIDFSKAQKELNFSPSKSIDEWLEETVKWYVDNKWWWKSQKAEADRIAEKYLANPLK